MLRVTSWTMLLACGFALVSHNTTSGQEPALPRKNSAAFTAVRGYYEEERRGIPKENLDAARASFQAFAKYYADVVAHPAVWKASQELKTDTPVAVIIPTLDGPNGILREMDRYIIEPTPGGQTRGNLNPADYIREMGAALDAAFKNLIETHPERIVRVNAARVLAHVARTGAAAHWPTVTGLIASEKTPTEVKYYLFHAAGALLSAYDVTDPKMRKHAAPPPVVGALVKALEDCIGNPALLMPGFKPNLATEDQLQVIGLVRRQAVRALAQVKYVSIPGPEEKTTLYPAYTLVRVAMADPALNPPPGPAEAAEAAIGICNMAPMHLRQAGQLMPVKEYNADVAAEAVTQALVTFAGPRAANAFDRTLPWRSYSLRLAEALTKWRPMFDPFWDFLQPNKFSAQLVPAPVESLHKFAVPNVLAPMEKVDFMGKPDPAAVVQIEELRKRLGEMRNRPKRSVLLFDGVPSTTIEFPPPKKAEPTPPKKGGEPPPKK